MLWADPSGKQWAEWVQRRELGRTLDSKLPQQYKRGGHGGQRGEQGAKKWRSGMVVKSMDLTSDPVGRAGKGVGSKTVPRGLALPTTGSTVLEQAKEKASLNRPGEL